MSTRERHALLYAALVCTRVTSSEPDTLMVRRWLNSWVVVGLVVVGVARHGYGLSLTHDRNGWLAILHRSHVLYPWVGQILHWWPTPWRAVQDAAWRALDTSRASSTAS